MHPHSTRFIFVFFPSWSYFSSSLSEPLCARSRWGLWGSKERVPSPGHVIGGPHRPPHPPHAQHHPGKSNFRSVVLLDMMTNPAHWLRVIPQVPIVSDPDFQAPMLGYCTIVWFLVFCRLTHPVLAPLSSPAVHAAADSGSWWERGSGGLWVLVDFGRATHL